MSKLTLQDFYKDLQSWIDGGCPESEHEFSFTKKTGLCQNLRNWCKMNGIYSDYLHELKDELSYSFRKANLSQFYPFNDTPKYRWVSPSYYAEEKSGKLYFNPARLDWIKSHAEKEF